MKRERGLSGSRVSPADILAVSRKLAHREMTRGRLRERHHADMKLARNLASRLHLSRVPETSILWLEEGELVGEAVAELEELGLVWRPPVLVVQRQDPPVNRLCKFSDAFPIGLLAFRIIFQKFGDASRRPLSTEVGLNSMVSHAVHGMQH